MTQAEDQADLLRRIRDAASEHPALDLLVLHGSRARGDAHARSDWDFGYRARERFSPDDLIVQLARILGADEVDLVDLDRAGGLLRFRAARDGIPLFDATGDSFHDFAVEAASFWCDMGPILSRAYESVLQRLPT